MNRDRWKQIFKQKNSILILILVGLILVVISIPTEKKKEANDADTQEETYESDSDYAAAMERKLERILEQMEGVGQVSVMITLKSTEENIVEKDLTDNQSESTGGTDSQKETDRSETTVFEEHSDGTQSPYVTKKVTPEIDGIMIVAEGGDNAVVIENITDAVKALFDVDMHKIKVIKRKSS